MWTVLQLPRRCAAARTSEVPLRFRSVEAVSIEHLHVEPVQVIQLLFNMKFFAVVASNLAQLV